MTGIPPPTDPPPGSPQATVGYGAPGTGYRGQHQPSNGLGIAALVVGIAALVLSWFPFLGLVLGIVALVLGIVGLRKASRLQARNEGQAIAGVVMGSIATLIGMAVAVAIPLVSSNDSEDLLAIPEPTTSPDLTINIPVGPTTTGAPAATVPPTTTLEPTTTAPPTTAAGPQWVEVASLSGRTEKRGPVFVLEGDETRLRYTSDGFVFVVYVVEEGDSLERSGGFPEVSCFDGPCSDVTFLAKGPGRYYLDVTASGGGWAVKIEELRR